MKTCSKCQRKLPDSKFYKRGSGGLQSKCKQCHKEYRQKHYADNKQKYIDKAAKWMKDRRAEWKEYKATLACETCGEDHPACLDFHHPNDDKEFDIGSMVGKVSLDVLKQEVSKCLVVCSNCHRKIHYVR